MEVVPKPTVLIVDEVPSIIRLLELELGMQGYATAGCGIGEDAFRAVEELHPDAILLELLLPGMSGLDMLRQLKERYDIPVVILTTINSEADRAAAFELGANDFVHKPFDPEELGQRVSALIGGGSRPIRLLHVGDMSIDLTRQVARRGSEVLSLTTNEWATLLALSMRSRQWVPSHELLTLVAGPDAATNHRLLLPVISRLRTTLERDPEHPEVLLGDLVRGYMLALDVDVQARPE